jgi:hypothetical protein
MDGQMSRRGFLSGGSAAAAAAVMGSALAGARYRAEPHTASLQRAMIIQVAQVGAVFPLRLPTLGQASPARARARRAISRLRTAQGQLGPGLLQLGAARRPSLARLRATEPALPAAEHAAGRAGADLLIRAGLLGSGHAPLLAGLGHLAATGQPAERAALLGAATLAVRTVFGDAAHHRARTAADQWLGVLSALHEQGTLQTAIRQRGLR